jgi:hypothetical protein
MLRLALEHPQDDPGARKRIERTFDPPAVVEETSSSPHPTSNEESDSSERQEAKTDFRGPWYCPIRRRHNLSAQPEQRRIRANEPPDGPSSAEQVGARSSRPRTVGDEASNREGPLVEIRVAVEDDTRVPELVRRLARVFDRSSISFDRSRNEVRVASEWESRTVMGVVEIIQAWLSENGAESATLWLGNRSYMLGPATPLTVIR